MHGDVERVLIVVAPPALDAQPVRRTHRGRARPLPASSSYEKLHAVEGDVPPGVDHGALLRRAVDEDGIRVVDVRVDLARYAQASRAAPGSRRRRRSAGAPCPRRATFPGRASRARRSTRTCRRKRRSRRRAARPRAPRPPTWPSGRRRAFPFACRESRATRCLRATDRPRPTRCTGSLPRAGRASTTSPASRSTSLPSGSRRHVTCSGNRWSVRKMTFRSSSPRRTASVA